MVVLGSSRKNEMQATVVTFYTNADAMFASKVLGSLDNPGRLIPLPRAISAGCGYAWRDDPSKKELVTTTLNNAKVKFENIVDIEL